MLVLFSSLWPHLFRTQEKYFYCYYNFRFVPGRGWDVSCSTSHTKSMGHMYNRSFPSAACSKPSNGGHINKQSFSSFRCMESNSSDEGSLTCQDCHMALTDDKPSLETNMSMLHTGKSHQ